jgi:CDP-glucose 4,6-dehydratase
MVTSFKNGYRGKKVFVTGHTGFKGSWLISWLHLLGAEIKGYALKPEAHNLYDIMQGDTLCTSCIADIRDKELLKREILDFEPDYIFHLAAQPLVRASYEIPVETFEINVTGTANLLDALRFLNKQCAVVVITTDKVYENKEWLYPYRENDALGGYDAYSASKACAELVVASYRNSFFHPEAYTQHRKTIVTARAGNVIGGGDWAKDRIIPDIIRSLMKGEEILVRNPQAIRPWQHVLEPLSGYLLLPFAVENDPTNHALHSFNFGPSPNDVLPVSSLVEKAMKRWGAGTYHTPDLQGQPHEAGILKLDISKASELLAWNPQLNAKEAIDWTIDWYKAGADKQKEMTFNQISQYSEYL